MFIKAVAAIGILFLMSDFAVADSFDKYFIAAANPLCGLRDFKRLEMRGGALLDLRPPVICRHLANGIGVAQVPNAQLKAIIDFDLQARGRGVFDLLLTPLSEYNQTVQSVCVGPNAQFINYVCIAAKLNQDRSDLMKVKSVRAIEVLDNYVGATDFGQQSEQLRLQNGLAFLSKAPVGSPVSPFALIQAMGLDQRMSEVPPDPRLEMLPWLGDAVGTKKQIKLASPAGAVVSIEATMTMVSLHQPGPAGPASGGGVVLMIETGQISASDKSRATVAVRIGWCRSSGDNSGAWLPLWGQAQPLLLMTFPTPDGKLRLDGLWTSERLPLDDKDLKNTWPCLAAEDASALVNFAHDTGAPCKSCK